ncbi:transposase, IS5 family [Pseudomonas agarici]|nr:transposase, IS5 family [Pseudomonas agarici]
MINGYLGDLGLSFPQGTIFDATLIHAPSLAKNKNGKRDPDMHQAKKGNQYYFGAKAHVGADDESGLVHSVVITAADVANVTQVDKLLHGEENVVRADAGYTGSRGVKSSARVMQEMAVANRLAVFERAEKRRELNKFQYTSFLNKGLTAR